jgi:hypothetical protein
MPYITIDVALMSVIFQHTAHFICIALAIFVSFRFIQRNIPGKRPASLWLFSIFLVTAAIYDLLNFSNYEYYRSIFQQLSDIHFHVRYIFSICLRLFMMAVGYGLFVFKEKARKGTLYFAVFTIVTIFWRHPFYVFERIAIMAEQNYFEVTVRELAYSAFPWISMFFYMTIDLMIAGLLLFYFTRPNVVSLYKHENTSQ